MCNGLNHVFNRQYGFGRRHFGSWGCPFRRLAFTKLPDEGGWYTYRRNP